MVVIGTAAVLAALRKVKPSAAEAQDRIDPDELAATFRAATRLNRSLPSPIGRIPTALYLPDFISADEEQGLLQRCNFQTWIELKRRRLQQFGGEPQVGGVNLEPLPSYLDALIDRIMAFDIFSEDRRPNHVLVNQYRPGEGIMAHSDGPLYHPCVVIVSTGSSCVMSFYSSSTAASSLDAAFKLFLRRRSLLVFRDDLYRDYLHQIETDQKDYVDGNIANMAEAKISLGSVYPRSTRTSFTIRHVTRIPRQ